MGNKGCNVIKSSHCQIWSVSYEDGMSMSVSNTILSACIGT